MDNTQTLAKKPKQTKSVKKPAQESQPPVPESATTENNTTSTNSEETASSQEQKEVRLVDIAIDNENTALNVLVAFLNVAHKRGAFTIDESAKIWECISKFQKN